MVKEQTRQLEDTNSRLVYEAAQRQQSQERYRLVEAAVNDGLWDWDIPARKIYYSPRWKSMLGWACDSFCIATEAAEVLGYG